MGRGSGGNGAGRTASASGGHKGATGIKLSPPAGLPPRDYRDHVFRPNLGDQRVTITLPSGQSQAYWLKGERAQIGGSSTYYPRSAIGDAVAKAQAAGAKVEVE